MKIVNPKLDEFGEGLQLEEPFMLWCDEQKRYHIAIARLWSDAQGGYGSTDVVVGSAQQPNNILRYFTVGQRDRNGHDLFQSMSELLLLFSDNNYRLLYKL